MGLFDEELGSVGISISKGCNTQILLYKVIALKYCELCHEIQTNITLTWKAEIMNFYGYIDKTWAIQKVKMMLQFPFLNDEDFYYDYGKKDYMITDLHHKIGMSRKEFDAFLLTLA